MKKTYQIPHIEITALEPIHLIAETVKDIQGISNDIVILKYDGGGSGPARAGENNLWEEEGVGSDWDNL